MTVDQLVPCPQNNRYFRRDEARFVPEALGCYALTTIEHVVLYVGLATNLRERMIQHLDTPEKVLPTPLGRAIGFYWREDEHLERLERSWMNLHLVHEGALPVLNKAYSPVHR